MKMGQMEMVEDLSMVITHVCVKLLDYLFNVLYLLCLTRIALTGRKMHNHLELPRLTFKKTLFAIIVK
jgi:hypothetical protein